MHPETTSIRSGLDYCENTGAVTPPIFQTSTFAHGNAAGFDYTRSGNPNFRNLEAALSALENARFATVFASGVSAITAVVSTLKQGDVILAEENLYGCTYRLFEQILDKFGVKTVYCDLSEQKSYSQIKTIKPALVWIESPTNPLLKIIDIQAVSEACKKSGSTLVVDNTFASPYFQKPLDLGADISLSSTTKYINGHSDALGGVVVTNNPNWNEKMIFAQKALGLQPSPFDAWLTARGVKTLIPRMKAHAENALLIAQYLADQPLVDRVLYPFHRSHPQYKLAKQQMSGGSGIVSVELGLTKTETFRFLKSLKLFTLAESLGGVESLVCHPASMTHAAIPREQREKVGIADGLIRFSVGIEHSEDLLNDLRQAFQQTLQNEEEADLPVLGFPLPQRIPELSFIPNNP